MQEIKKILYDIPKIFYDYLRRIGKVDVYGNILIDKLNGKEIEIYNKIMANKVALENEYFAPKNKTSTKKNTPSFKNSKFGEEFYKLKTKVVSCKLKLKKGEKIPLKIAKNLDELTEKINNLHNDYEIFYNKLCEQKEQKKVDKKGNIIKSELNENEEQTCNKLIAEKDNIIKTYFPGNKTIPRFGLSEFGIDFLNLNLRALRINEKIKSEMSNEIKTNLENLVKTIKDLYSDALIFYNVLRYEEKVDDKGNIIKSSLSKDQEQTLMN